MLPWLSSRERVRNTQWCQGIVIHTAAPVGIALCHLHYCRCCHHPRGQGTANNAAMAPSSAPLPLFPLRERARDSQRWCQGTIFHSATVVFAHHHLCCCHQQSCRSEQGTANDAKSLPSALLPPSSSRTVVQTITKHSCSQVGSWTDPCPSSLSWAPNHDISLNLLLEGIMFMLGVNHACTDWSILKQWSLTWHHPFLLDSYR